MTAYLDVTTQGVTGNGHTDDAPAIQALIDRAQAQGGGVLYFPPGTYAVSSRLVISSHNVVLLGAGNSSTIRSTSRTEPVISIGHPETLNHCTNCKVLLLTIDRGPSPGVPSSGIAIERARYVLVEQTTLHRHGTAISVGVPGGSGIPTQFVHLNEIYATDGDFPHAGIHMYQAADITLSRSFIEPSHRGIVMSDNCNGVFITQTTIINGGAFDYGVVSEGGSCQYLLGVNIENARHQQIYLAGSGDRRFVVANCWLGAGDTYGDTRRGILIESGVEHVTITGTRIGDQRLYGIETYGSQITITGNTIHANGTLGSPDGAWDGIYIGGGQDIIVQNNLCSRNDGFGIRVDSRARYAIVANNICHGNRKQPGLSPMVSVSESVISGNIVHA